MTGTPSQLRWYTHVQSTGHDRDTKPFVLLHRCAVHTGHDRDSASQAAHTEILTPQRCLLGFTCAGSPAGWCACCPCARSLRPQPAKCCPACRYMWRGASCWAAAHPPMPPCTTGAQLRTMTAGASLAGAARMPWSGSWPARTMTWVGLRRSEPVVLAHAVLEQTQCSPLVGDAGCLLRALKCSSTLEAACLTKMCLGEDGPRTAAPNAASWAAALLCMWCSKCLGCVIADVAACCLRSLPQCSAAFGPLCAKCAGPALFCLC